MKRLVYVQANLRMVQGMTIGESTKELNHKTINIIKVPILLTMDEEMITMFFYGRRMQKDVGLKELCLW
jgi:hypothetical protein